MKSSADKRTIVVPRFSTVLVHICKQRKMCKYRKYSGITNPKDTEWWQPAVAATATCSKSSQEPLFVSLDSTLGLPFGC